MRVIKRVPVPEWALRRYAEIVTLLYGAVLVLGLSRHEMWRDELQAWMIAANASSLSGLFGNLYYELHPALWHLALFSISRLTNNPAYMQALHAIIGIAAAYVVLRWAPFSRWVRTLLVFGYFPLFEYGLISRNYSLSILFALVFCALYGRARRPYVALGVTLFLLCQSSAMGLLMAAGLGGYMALDYLSGRKKLSRNADGLKHVAAGAALALGGALLALWQAWPKADSAILIIKDASIARVVSSIWQSYVPVPMRRIDFWNTNIVGSVNAKVALSVILVALAVWFLARRPKALVFYLVTTTVYLAFFQTQFLGTMRHHGFLFFVLVAALWLAALEGDKRLASMNRYTAAVCVLLAVHVLAAGYALKTDWSLPFSHARETAAYIQSAFDKDVPIAGYRDYQASAVAGFLGRPIYYPQSDINGTFVVWQKRRQPSVEMSALLDKAASLQNKTGRDTIVLINTPAFGNGMPYKDRTLTLARAIVSPAIAADEIYYVYVLRE